MSMRGTLLPYGPIEELLPLAGEVLPYTWRVPLDDGGILKVRVWPVPEGTPRVQRELGVEDAPPCCTTLAEFELCGTNLWRRSVPTRSVRGLEHLLDGGLGALLGETIRGQVLETAARIREAEPVVQPAVSDTGCGVDAPCGAESASVIGLLESGEEGCCAWAVPETIETWYVSKQGVDLSSPTAAAATGRSRLKPTTLDTVRALLRDASVTYEQGLQILFRRGEQWDWSDAVEDEGRTAFLHIRASGTEEAPIFVGSYYYDDPSTASHDSFERPKFIGDGFMDLMTTPATIEPASGRALLVEGAKWVQISGLQITNSLRGVEVFSYAGEDYDQSLTGARHINLLGLKIWENWRDGVSIETPLETVTAALGYTSKVVIGDGTLYAVTDEGALALLDTDDAGWWPECVCIEDCEIFANGEGASSAGVNIGLSNFSALCTIRRNLLYGAEHSAGWPNQCGRYLLGYEAQPDLGDAENFTEFWNESAGALLLTWGSDGITMTNGGCGHVIENNRIYNHVPSQGTSGACRQDDGNGVDLKRTGNRTHWKTDLGTRVRVLRELPIVIRNNELTENWGPALVLHFGCRGLHVYNNIFSYNLGNEGSAISINAGDLKNGWWLSEYLESDGYLASVEASGTSIGDGGGHVAPALVQDIFIYRNMIYKNGYIPGPTPAEDELVSIDGVGQNAIHIEKGSGVWYHGSLENFWIVNNTITNNLGYGLSILFRTDDEKLDADTFYFNDLNIINNIFSFNTTKDRSEKQVKLDDTVSEEDLSRGFVCRSLRMDNNCYYSYFGEDVINFMSQPYTLLEFMSANVTLLDSETGEEIELCNPALGTRSIQEDPLFQDMDENDYHLNSTSPCIEAGGDVDASHFETDASISMSADFDYQDLFMNMDLGLIQPDIGADEYIMLVSSDPVVESVTK